jgi:hypothetical protein
MIASAAPEHLAKAVRAVLGSADIDGLIALFVATGVWEAGSWMPASG